VDFIEVLLVSLLLEGLIASFRSLVYLRHNFNLTFSEGIGRILMNVVMKVIN